MKKSDRTDPKARLERAIAYWIEYQPLATIEEIKRVAKKFGVHQNSLREAVRLLGEVERKEKRE